MKFLTLSLLLAVAMLAGCSATPNTTGNANIRGTNTNTGYVTNSNATVKPTIPPNATNLTPGNMMGNNNSNSNMNSNMNRTNRNMNK